MGEDAVPFQEKLVCKKWMREWWLEKWFSGQQHRLVFQDLTLNHHDGQV